MEKIIEIPEGYEARIEGNKVILERKESEDERIRSLLVWQVHRNIDDETNDLAKSVYDGIKGHDPDLEESIEDWKKCLAYLERQKEQKPVKWSEEDVEKLAKIRASKSGVLTSEMTFYRQGVRDAFNYKGLRPSWKPSREQLLALKEQTSWLSKTNPLHSLYHQLCEL
jgi:hypothetical protein